MKFNIKQFNTHEYKKDPMKLDCNGKLRVERQKYMIDLKSNEYRKSVASIIEQPSTKHVARHRTVGNNSNPRTLCNAK